MDYMLDLSELINQLKWMAQDGCDVICVSVLDGSDGQQPAVRFDASKRSDPGSPIYYYLGLDIRHNI